MRRGSPRRFTLTGLVLTTLVLAPAPAHASDEFPDPDPVVGRIVPRAGTAAGAFATANSNCAGAACDTVWVGHSNAGPGGAFLGVGVGGVWDFDTGIAGTDSTQGWQRYAYFYTLGGQRPALDRPEWALDYGNMICEGNTNLWHARDLAGRKYVRFNAIGAWHADDMAGVKKKLNDGAEPSAVPIAGARSAWCGLRASGDMHAVDPITGNGLNGDIQHLRGSASVSNPDFPGYCNLWDQMLYKDFASTGTGTIEFRVRTDLSTFIDNALAPEITGWFNPDPTSLANFVGNPADSFMVYVGSPNENAYDTNRRWFSEVLDVSLPYQELFAVSGHYPFVTPDTLISRAFSALAPVTGNVRVVFRVKTNRARADMSTGTATGFNSKDGAAVLDQVKVDAGPTYGFDAISDVTARELVPNLAAAGGAWVTTGKPAPPTFHIDNVGALLYEDLCGGVGSPVRQCNLAGNVLVGGDADHGNQFTDEVFQGFESPTIDLAVRTAAPGTKNAQGIDRETALRTVVVMDYDLYSGFMGLDQSVFWYFGGRFHGPTNVQPQSGNRCWSPTVFYPIPIWNPDPLCFHQTDNISSLGLPGGAMDSLRLKIATFTQFWRYGGSDLGNTRGTYFDNFRAGFVRAAGSALLSQDLSNKYQDQFPFNEGPAPADNAAFDTTTALVRTGLNIVNPPCDPGVVAGDSIVAASVYVGDGVTTGVRLDLVFRIDPGPANYTTKGFRTSALVNRDPAHPFFATYLANNGPFGTPGGHGPTWNRNVWNSARMDSAELNLYPIVSRGINIPASPNWMGTLHEQDPNFLTLGIAKNVCFLVDPAGVTSSTNIECDGTPPPGYGGAAGTSREGTKILPDGWFTPGTHVEYFLRRSTIESPGTAQLLFDTTRVYPQDPGGSTDYDQERWSSFDVLPDMWKSTRYGGTGLACFLMIDGADRRGADPAYRGAADTLGYGKGNGATSGWKGLGPGSDPNDPAGFVAANLGQYGLKYDHYDIRAAENTEAGHPGVRLASNTGAIALKGDKSGPSAAMLAAFYTTVLHLAGDLDRHTLHDHFECGEGANDVALYEGFLAGATPSNRRGLWLSGDGIMADGSLWSDNGTVLLPFLSDTFGSTLTADSYKAYSNAQAFTVGMVPTAFWAHPGRIYGLYNICTVQTDVLALVPTVDGATEAAQYQNLGPGPWTASIFRPTNENAGRSFRTLIDGFDLSNVRGNYASFGQIATLPGTDVGRMAWFDDVWSGLFQACARPGPIVGIGDLPGRDGTVFANAVLGAMPNPAFVGRNVTLRFSVAVAREITLRIYNVAGREIKRLSAKADAGPNTLLWDGTLSNGAHAAAGVYFYSVDGIEPGGRASKMILLSSR
jgi:hypothetical protein